MNTQQFRTLLTSKGRELYRPMPWRNNTSPYYVLVSEIMLQQTQVDRVVPKFTAFIKRFPTQDALAQASQADVIAKWSGLGYNRRAIFLHKASQHDITDDIDALVQLPGVGHNTAAAIVAYAFNKPSIFIETNIRTVLLHHFFHDQAGKISDNDLKTVLEPLVDQDNPRKFYWAMMDYGAWLKRNGYAHLGKAAAHKKQSRFKGSTRETRGAIIAHLVNNGQQSMTSLNKAIAMPDRFSAALQSLADEGVIIVSSNSVKLA